MTVETENLKVSFILVASEGGSEGDQARYEASMAEIEAMLLGILRYATRSDNLLDSYVLGQGNSYPWRTLDVGGSFVTRSKRRKRSTSLLCSRCDRR